MQQHVGAVEGIEALVDGLRAYTAGAAPAAHREGLRALAAVVRCVSVCVPGRDDSSAVFCLNRPRQQ